MDDLDRSILSALQEDGRTPFTQIAKSAGVSESTIRSRYASLVDQGIVQTIAVINPFAVGYQAPAMLGVSTEPGMQEEAARALAALPEVSYLVLAMGRFDLLVEVFCRDLTHLSDLITHRICLAPGIRATETLVIGKIYKLSFFWSPEAESAAPNGSYNR